MLTNVCSLIWPRSQCHAKASSSPRFAASEKEVEPCHRAPICDKPYTKRPTAIPSLLPSSGWSLVVATTIACINDRRKSVLSVLNSIDNLPRLHTQSGVNPYMCCSILTSKTELATRDSNNSRASKGKSVHDFEPPVWTSP